MIRSVSAQSIDYVWPEIEQWIKDACEYTDVINSDDVLDAIRNQKMQCFVVGDPLVAAYVTEIQQYPRKKILRMVSMGGSGLDSWLGEVAKMMDDWAKELGAKVEYTGRRGWVKKLAPFGWKEISVTCERVQP